MLRFSVAVGLLVVIPCGFSQDTSRAKLTGFSDAAIEESGKIKQVDISGKIEVRAAGVYRLTFELGAANGNALTGRAKGRLEPGSRTLTASFEAEQIRKILGQDGPYRISDARLFFEAENAEPEFAGSLADGGATKLYRLRDLYRELYFVLPEIQAEGIDVQPSGSSAGCACE